MITVVKTQPIIDIQNMTEYSCSAPFEIFRQRQVALFSLVGFDDTYLALLTSLIVNNVNCCYITIKQIIQVCGWVGVSE